MTEIDLTAAPNARVGSVVTLIGADGDAVISADDWAAWSDTINYEIVTRLPSELRREYTDPGSRADLVDGIGDIDRIDTQLDWATGHVLEAVRDTEIHLGIGRNRPPVRDVVTILPEARTKDHIGTKRGSAPSIGDAT